jgi:hypothetical protein
VGAGIMVLRAGCNPVQLIDWETMQAYSQRDIFCSKHGISVGVFPSDPYQEWEYIKCERCPKKITKEEIITAFCALEELIEQEMKVAIIFYNGTLLVESTELEYPDHRRLVRHKSLSGKQIETIKLAFKGLMEKALGISIESVSDIFQK